MIRAISKMHCWVLFYQILQADLVIKIIKIPERC